MVVVEYQVETGGGGQPRVGLDFLVQLPGAPMRIAECQQTLLRAVAGGNCLQHVQACGQRHLVVHLQAALAGPVGGVEHEAACAIHRATVAQLDAPGRRGGGHFQLLQQVLESRAGEWSVKHQAHRALLGVGAEIDHGMREPLVLHAGHGDQQLPGQAGVILGNDVF